MKRKVPCQAVSNRMELYAVPMQLKCLRKLESVLVSQRIMFEKIVVMPRGKQRKIYGTVCNIPVNCDTVCQSLPRPPESSGIIMLKLKRKLKYHGHQYYESVRPTIVYDALDYLRNNNTLYSNIDIVMTNIDNELVGFENPQELPADTNRSHDDEKLPTEVCNLHENKELSTEVGSSPEDDCQSHSSVGNQQYNEDSISINKSTKTHVLSSNSEQIDSGNRENIDQVDSDEEEIEDLQNMSRTNTNETCLQPLLPDYPLDIDRATESSCTENTVTDRDGPQSSRAGNEIFSIAPGEGKHPVHFMTDKLCEEMAFPTLFPTRKFGFQVKRDVRLSPAKYFNARLLNYTGRFATNPEYLFFAQYVTEQKKVQDSISIALKKVHHGHSLTAGEVRSTDSSSFQNLTFSDQAYLFMKNIPGSPSYWKRFMYEVIAMIKQLDPPSWWMTLSCADLRWNEIYKILSKLKGREMTDDEIATMSYEEKCKMLNSNPVVVAKQLSVSP